MISVDIDDGKPIDELLQDPVVAGHATIIYTTHSHTLDAPRYRVVFALPRTITDAKEAVAVARSLTLTTRRAILPRQTRRVSASARLMPVLGCLIVRSAMNCLNNSSRRVREGRDIAYLVVRRPFGVT